MLTIAIIVSDDEFSFLADSILAGFRHPGIAHVIVKAYGTNVDALDLGHPDIILARGLTGQALRAKYPGVTVMEMPTGAQDILNAVGACRRIHSARRVLILGTESFNLDVDNLQDIVSVGMRLKRIANEEDIAKALASAREEGFDAVVGGFTACKLAQERGWDCAYVRTSDETFRLAVAEVMKTAQVMFTERARAESYRSILDSANEAILHFDRDGVLLASNRRAREMLPLPAEPGGAPCRAEQIFNDRELTDILRSHSERRGFLCNINKLMLVANCIPVRFDDRAIGMVCTFQPANEIQAAENMIRKATNKQGLSAKYGFSDLIHASEVMAETISTARKYAGVDANILLVGETGTGKELFAQSIHNASNRAAKPFVAINCAAFPDTLLESELFGYADGAFSGAVRGGKTGLFELAHGGTMFLDEVGEIPLNLQPKLLRALQEREIRKIGDDRVIPVDVRIIAATNQDLWERTEQGNFRSDLLHRLDVLSLFIPPLRERPADIRPIAEYHLATQCREQNRRRLHFAEDAFKVLERHGWPGNTRELRNVCERLAILCDAAAAIPGEVVKKMLRPAGSRSGRRLPAAGVREGEGPKSLPELVALSDSLRLNRGELAALLGISRSTLFRKLKELGGDNETQPYHHETT